jgi:hypothetical protein
MTTTDNIEVQQAIHQAATKLASLAFIDQETARQVSPVAEAVANMFTILYYQAETGRATPDDFEQALDTIRQVTRNQGKR